MKLARYLVMLDVRDLYQEVIIDHNRNPRNFKKLDKPSHCADGFNPLCGDKITLQLSIKNNIIEDACFTGNGCAISTASASLMTEQIKQMSPQQAQQLFTQIHSLLTVSNSTPDCGKLNVLSGVKAFPSRVKCATLAWHTLKHALQQNSQTAATENE